MCLSIFFKFKNIPENEPLTGYRSWRNLSDDNTLILKSQYKDYDWNKTEGPHEVRGENSGIYSYNNYCNYYNYYNYRYYHYYYTNYNNNDNHNNNFNYNSYYYNNGYRTLYYDLAGIVKQWGKVAFHKDGYRSEYAKIDTLFSIRETDAKGPEKFTEWIKIFNEKIEKIASKYELETINWQDFIELNKVSTK